MTTTTPALVAALLGPAGPEIGCDECFERLDAYVEQELAGQDAEASTPGMRAHLAGCPACHEEHESLHALVVAERRRVDR
ncbi:MAG TPA: zf-HC2 domain-containing protein [Gaiellales bacterium]|jgi:anti-sigma factor RsiW|nr:zf-HC2 domain-containing protein [Gaiellales bacterium]